jgi:hypothetical protein
MLSGPHLLSTDATRASCRTPVIVRRSSDGVTCTWNVSYPSWMDVNMCAELEGFFGPDAGRTIRRLISSGSWRFLKETQRSPAPKGGATGQL